jgi:16S rRNA (guanine966-N2)-methyltransferase
VAIRVIAGTAKGRRLKLVPGDSTRPIMDRVKEALFSIIGSSIYDANFLDLFAGTGSVGIEALSRGVNYALFLDLDRDAVKTIHENLSITGFTENATVRRMDAFALLHQPPDRAYNFIYIAPPQYKGLWQKTLQALDANPLWLEDDTVVIVQLDPSEQDDVSLNHLQRYDERRYGNTLLWFFEKNAPVAEELNVVVDFARLETVAQELMDAFKIVAPPIPIESMLQRPAEEMWEEVDISQLSSSFLNISQSYSPRMSLARLLARHVVNCPWGAERELTGLDRDENKLYRFARMLVMPASMVIQLTPTARTPHLVSVHFEVPETDAQLRLQELTVNES